MLMLARKSASGVDDRDERDFLMGEIGQDLAKGGEIAFAREAFALMVDDKWHDYSTKPFLQNELSARQFGDAQLTVEAMRTVQGKAEALCSLASAQWQSGHHDAGKKALAAAERIYATNKKLLANAEFLEQLSLTQDELDEGARSSMTKRELDKLSVGTVGVADKVDSSWLDSESEKLRVTGRTEMQKGNMSAARSSLQHAAKEIETVPRAGDKAILLHMIASDQARAGDREGARNSFLQAADIAKSLLGIDRDLILRDISREQASAGYVEDSLEVTTKISDIHLKGQALHGIAVSQSEQEGLEVGLKTAEQIQTESEYDMTLVDIAKFLARGTDTQQIYRIVDMVHTNYMKAIALIDAAEVIGGQTPNKSDDR
jgi:hypothetical protein